MTQLISELRSALASDMAALVAQGMQGTLTPEELFYLARWVVRQPTITPLASKATAQGTGVAFLGLDTLVDCYAGSNAAWFFACQRMGAMALVEDLYARDAETQLIDYSDPQCFGARAEDALDALTRLQWDWREAGDKGQLTWFTALWPVVAKWEVTPAQLGSWVVLKRLSAKIVGSATFPIPMDCIDDEDLLI
jgi:hypothetical protein